MALSPQRAVEQARLLLEFHKRERIPLDEVRRYLTGAQRLPAVIPNGSPNEVKVMARSSRTNLMGRVVDAMVQKVFVDGFRAERESDDLDVWAIWQANRMDARQSAIHRAAFAYGTAYAVVLPGDPRPVIRGVSPRAMTAVYGEDQDWPLWALEHTGPGSWALYDDECVYYLGDDEDEGFNYLESREHGAPGVTPVVRYVDAIDLDEGDEPAQGPRSVFLTDADDIVPFPRGQVGPLMRLQDQLDLTTFSMQVAQHYGAFRQRYVIGWVADTERDAVKTSASQLWGFDMNPDDVKIGEFDQTNLDGYLRSREATVRHIAIVSQTPLHELMPDLANPTSAEALAAQESGHERKIDERKALLGEAHEQTLWLAGRYSNVDVPDDAQVVWRDTSARAFAATVDGLGKLTTMLGIPPQELWDRVPGASRQDVERWKSAAAQGDPFADLAAILDRQARDTPIA